MGGPGSGNYWHTHRPPRKRTVEGCLCLDVNRWSRAGTLRAGVRSWGTDQWTDRRTGRELASVAVVVDTRDMSAPWASLRYTVTPPGERVDCAVRLTTTRPHLGGLRWWFACPMPGPDGAPCGGRVGRLYLPPGGRHFGCRHCHDLTYTSCRESHKDGCLCRVLAERLGWEPEDVRRYLAERGERDWWLPR